MLLNYDAAAAAVASVSVQVNGVQALHSNFNVQVVKVESWGRA